MRLFVAFMTALLTAGCPGRENVQCKEDTDCDLSTGGACTLASTGNKWCAYPDPACPTGFRYSNQDVGDEVGGTCTEGPAITKHTLVVQVGGNGNGNVASDPAGLTCSSGTGTCMGEFAEGTLVQLAATATAGSFLGWDSACTGQGACSVTMDKDQMVGALFGTPGEALWAKQFGGMQSDAGTAVAVDADGDLVVVGTFRQTITFGTTMLTSAGGVDFYVAKLSSSTGDTIWAKRFGGTSTDNGFAVAVDASKNIYVGGTFQGSVDFGGGALQPTGPTAAFVLKLDTAGTFGWATKIDGGGFGERVAVATNGSVVAVTGSYGGTISLGVSSFTSAGSTDIFAAQLGASTGAPAWLKSFGGTLLDFGNGIAIDGSNNVVITGAFKGTVNFGGGSFTTPNNLDDGFLLKLSGTDGAHLVSKQFGGPSFDVGSAVVVDAANNIFVWGDFRDTASFGCPSTLTSSQTDQSDLFLVKYTQAGACSFAKAFTGSGAAPSRHATALTVNPAGDVAATGSFCGSITLGGSALVSASACPGTDMFAVRFRNDGTHLNSVRAGGTTGSEEGAAIVQSTDGRFFVTGGFTGFAEFGGDAFTSAGGLDAFVVALAPL